MANETLVQLTETYGTPLLVADIPADLVPPGIYIPDKIAIFPLDRKRYGGCIVFANNVSDSDPDKDQWTANSGERIAITMLLDRLAAVQEMPVGGPLIQWRKQGNDCWGDLPGIVDNLYYIEANKRGYKARRNGGFFPPNQKGDLLLFETPMPLGRAKAACQDDWEYLRQHLAHRLTCIDATALHQHDTSDDMLYARIHRRIRLDLERLRIERGSPYFSEKEIDDMVEAALNAEDETPLQTPHPRLPSPDSPVQTPNSRLPTPEWIPRL